MASKEDLTEQLALTQKLAAQVERMAQAAERAQSAYEGQIATVERLAAVLNQVNTSGFTQGVDTMNRAVKESSKAMQDMGKSSSAAFKAMGKKVEETSKTLGERFPKGVAVATAAWSGFQQGIRNILALGKGFIGFTTSVVSGLADIAASIIAIPFKMFEGLIDLAAKSMSGMNELAQAIENIRKQFGALSGPTNKAIIDTSNSLKGFKDTGLSSWRVFGYLSQRLDYIRELATEMGGAFSKLRQEMEDNGGAILAYQKGLGIANEDMKGVTRNAVAMGKSTASSLKDMTKYSYELGDAFGLDAKLISRDMSKALSDVKHFGGATVKQIGEASTYARKLGFELKDIVGTLDAFDTFDTAAENAAKLSQAFGVNIDAFELMKAQSPDEQLELLRKSFRAAGVDASNFDRASLKLAATTTGLSEDIVQSALSMKNQGLRLDEIKKKGGDAEKKTLTQSQAMGKLADAIERLVMQGGNQLGGFWDTFLHGVLGGIESSKEFRMLMLDIQRALMQVRMIGVQLGRVLVNIMPGFKDILGGLEDIFKPQHFSKYFTDISAAVKGFLDPKSSNKDSLPRLFDGFRKATLDFFSATSPGGRRVLEGFKALFKALVGIVAKAIPLVTDQLVDGMQVVIDLISGRKSIQTGGASSAVRGGLGFLANLFEPIMKALKDAWKRLQPVLYELLSTLGEKALDWVKGHKELFAKIGLAIMGYLFATSMVSAVTGYISTLLVQSAAGVLSSVASGILRKLGADIMADMFENAPTEGVSKSVSAALKRAFTKASADGADVGDKIGSTAVSRMSGGIGKVADGFAQKLGASNFGSALGLAAGFAAAAYIAIEGKKLIDETFEKGHKADVNLRGSEMEAWSATSKRAPIEKKLEEIDKLQKAIADQQKVLDDKSFGEKALNWIAGTDVAADQAADALAKSRKTLEDLQNQVKSAQQTNAGAVEEARRRMQAQTNAQKFMGDVTLDDAKERLSSLDQVSKKVLGKGFDIQKTVDAVKEKFKGVSFDVLSADQAGSLGAGVEALKQVDTYFSTLNSTSDSLSRLRSSSLQKIVTAIKGSEKGQDGIIGALQAVNDMVAQTNQLNDALGRTTNIVDVKAKLDKVASAVGLGGKVSYTVNPSKEIALTVNLHVTMDAGTVERVIIERKESIIRDRLNFATSSPTSTANSTVSDTYGATPKQVGPAGTKT